MQEVLEAKSVATLTLDDLDRVAAIHRVAFPDSFLSGLGQGTVRRYYRWLLTGPHEVTAFGVSRDKELVGFAVGGVFKGALIGFLKKNCLALAWSVLVHPWLLVRRAHRPRLIAGARTVIPFLRCEAKVTGYSSEAGKTLGIMAIAVHPHCGRSGYGRLLMDAYDQVARERNYSRMQLRVNPANRAAIAFYEKLGWSRLEDLPWTGVMYKQVRPESPE